MFSIEAPIVDMYLHSDNSKFIKKNKNIYITSAFTVGLSGCCKLVMGPIHPFPSDLENYTADFNGAEGV